MTVGGTPGFYRSTFASTVNIPSGTFYVSINHANSPVYLANLSSGTAGGAFWRRGGGAFARSGIITRSSFRVLCAGGGSSNAVPAIGNSGLPEINQTYRVTGSIPAAPTRRHCWSLAGRTRAGRAAPLPFSLAGLGAPGCNLRVSLDLTTPTTLNSNGAGSLQIPVPQLVNADRPERLPPVDRDRRPRQQPRPRAERGRASQDRRLIVVASGAGPTPGPKSRRGALKIVDLPGRPTRAARRLPHAQPRL